MSDGRPHPEAVDSIITGPMFPFGTRIVDGELQLTGHRLAARVVLHGPSGKAEHLIVWDWMIGEKYVVRFLSFAYTSRRLGPIVPIPQGIMSLRCMRVKFIDDYRLFTAAASWVTTPKLWDTTIPAHVGSNPSV